MCTEPNEHHQYPSLGICLCCTLGCWDPSPRIYLFLKSNIALSVPKIKVYTCIRGKTVFKSLGKKAISHQTEVEKYLV